MNKQVETESAVPVRVAILLYDGVQVLDVGGPLEVFTTANMPGEGVPPGNFDVYTVGERPEPVQANNTGKVFAPMHTFANAPNPGILIVPGGDTARAEENERLIAWIRETSSGAELTASVCTGAFLLARAGLLSGKPATTHWYFLDRLSKEFPDVSVKRGVRYVDAGSVVTSAGISAGIDMSLAILRRYRGRERAEWTARVMQYESPGRMGP